ncbi:POK7 protein, partial [Amazona guildingii]|nr:POK7 protein [Amazona guildingii]
RDVIRHLTHAFATLGLPSQLKMDNGPGYNSVALSRFLQQWGVTHVTDIPHSPTGQGIVERTHTV